ncbi:hypothetical protein [Aristophania vespae]|uniref:hypothetical protein n=1 Tax=Aristophania vespae TaxID=2697033 RepID=UPI0023516354|nr:hypothetical protein [Aristophania vespae]
MQKLLQLTNLRAWLSIIWSKPSAHLNRQTTYYFEHKKTNCDFETSGDVKAGGISLKNHTHGGVQSGSSSTSAPQ